MQKYFVLCALTFCALSLTACGKKSEAPEGMAITTDQNGQRRLEAKTLPTDMPPEARQTATAATAEAQASAQQNAAMAQGLKSLRGR